MHVHLAVGPDFDLPVKRYPPHWRKMVGVKLTEAEAADDAAADALSRNDGRAAWPSISDLRGSAHPRNLATWASTVYDAASNVLRAVDLSATRSDRTSARHLPPTPCPASQLHCVVCGSRGGEVTLPALWLLGCRLPAVVINGGCAREAAAWLWPAGVPVVLLTGGQDKINNEDWQRPGGDATYVARLWKAVPEANKPTTALLHMPLMRHRPDVVTLGEVLPPLVRYAASGLAEASKPTSDCLSMLAAPCTLVTCAHPEGEVLVQPLSPLPEPLLQIG